MSSVDVGAIIDKLLCVCAPSSPPRRIVISARRGFAADSEPLTWIRLWGAGLPLYLLLGTEREEERDTEASFSFCSRFRVQFQIPSVLLLCTTTWKRAGWWALFHWSFYFSPLRQRPFMLSSTIQVSHLFQALECSSSTALALPLIWFSWWWYNWEIAKTSTVEPFLYKHSVDCNIWFLPYRHVSLTWNTAECHWDTLESHSATCQLEDSSAVFVRNTADF